MATIYDFNINPLPKEDKGKSAEILEVHNNINTKLNDLLVTCKEKDFTEHYICFLTYSQSKNINLGNHPCGYQFKVKENDLFPSVDLTTDETYYKFHCICPHCGYVVTIDKRILPEEIQNRYSKYGAPDVMGIFINRCQSSPNNARSKKR